MRCPASAENLVKPDIRAEPSPDVGALPAVRGRWLRLPDSLHRVRHLDPAHLLAVRRHEHKLLPVNPSFVEHLDCLGYLNASSVLEHGTAQYSPVFGIELKLV